MTHYYISSRPPKVKTNHSQMLTMLWRDHLLHMLWCKVKFCEYNYSRQQHTLYYTYYISCKCNSWHYSCETKMYVDIKICPLQLLINNFNYNDKRITQISFTEQLNKSWYSYTGNNTEQKKKRNELLTYVTNSLDLKSIRLHKNINLKKKVA